MKTEQLVKALEELQKICEFEPAIKTKGKSDEELKELLLEANESLAPKDVLSKGTKELFAELKITPGQKREEAEEEEEEVPAKKGKKATAKKEAEEEEETEEEEEETEEEETEEEEEAPAKKGKKAAPAPAKKGKEEKKAPAKKAKVKGEKKPGVIAVIVELIEGAKKKEGITKAEILKALKKKFPDRPEDSMKSTINVQVPNRITKERFAVAVTEKGGYYKK